MGAGAWVTTGAEMGLIGEMGAMGAMGVDGDIFNAGAAAGGGRTGSGTGGGGSTWGAKVLVKTFGMDLSNWTLTRGRA